MSVVGERARRAGGLMGMWVSRWADGLAGMTQGGLGYVGHAELFGWFGCGVGDWLAGLLVGWVPSTFRIPRETAHQSNHRAS